MANEEIDPQLGKEVISVPLSADFIEFCEERNLDSAVVAARVCELAVEVDRDAKDLFTDWDMWPKEDQLRFISGAVRARGRLEFPETGSQG